MLFLHPALNFLQILKFLPPPPEPREPIRCSFHPLRMKVILPIADDYTLIIIIIIPVSNVVADASVHALIVALDRSNLSLLNN